MDAAIIKQWNSQVNPDDEVYFLGDFGINKRKCLDANLVNSLNGKKYLILGNHDLYFYKCHRDPQKMLEVKEKFYNAGWHFADLALIRTLKNGQKCILTHLPYGDEDDNRYSEFKIKTMRPDLIQLHGHLHGKYRKKKDKIDVCFDGTLRLLTEDDIIDLIKDSREFIPTRLTDKLNKELSLLLKPFEDEVKKGYLRKVEDDNLILYNYRDKCVFDKAWNETNIASRGIIFEKDTGKLIALPFKKFFNYSELLNNESCDIMLKERDRLLKCIKNNEKYEVTEKIDGSLIILFNYNGEWRTATRGSLSSDQSIKAKELLKKYDLSKVPVNFTLLCKVIYPENRIVVNYGSAEKLILLAAIDRLSEKELDYDSILPYAYYMNMEMVPRYDYTIEETLIMQKTLPAEKEGFIVKFESGLRVKIKGEEYLKVHRLISHVSPIHFWQSMEYGKVNINYLKELPEEYRKEADEITEKLENKYQCIKDEIGKSVADMILEIGAGDLDNLEYRKKVGLYVKNKPKHYSAIFPVLLNKYEAIDKYIMKTIRPTGNAI